MDQILTMLTTIQAQQASTNERLDQMIGKHEAMCKEKFAAIDDTMLNQQRQLSGHTNEIEEMRRKLQSTDNHIKHVDWLGVPEPSDVW